MKKAARALAVLLVFLACASLPGRNLQTAQAAFCAVRPFGSLPEDYPAQVVEKGLLFSATAFPGGYLLPESAAGCAIIRMYDAQGRFVRTVRFPFRDEYFTVGPLIVTRDGGFAFAITPSGANRDNASPTLVRCDREGGVLWSRAYDGYAALALMAVFETESGGFVTAGQDERDAADELYLSYLDGAGNLLREARYGGSDHDQLIDAAYLGEERVAVVLATQSSDGDFAASRDGKSAAVLALIDGSPAPVWHIRLPYHVPRGEGFRAAGGAIYLSPFWGIREGESSLSDAVVCYDAAGRMVWERTFAEDTRFVDGEGTDMLALSCGQKLLLMDGAGNVARELTVDAGVIRKYIARADHELALSVNITGTLKTPLFVSRLYYRTEQVLNGYDSRGRLVWRYAVDNTPDYMSRTKTIRGDRRGVEDFLARLDEGEHVDSGKCYNITPDDIFEKTGWQIFKFSDTCESFLVCGDDVYPLGIGFGGLGLVDALLCDLDENGAYELLYTYSWGSGLHRSHLGWLDPQTGAQATADYAYMMRDMMLLRLWNADNSITLFHADFAQTDGVAFIDMTYAAGEALGRVVYEDGTLRVETPALD